MGMRITTNVAALTAQRHLVDTGRSLVKSQGQLASGSRIRQSADDAAGLAISENMKAVMRSSTQARRNANDGISLLSTAEGGLNETSNIVTRIRELSIQAASDTIGDRERGYVNLEMMQMKSELDRIAKTASWNSTKLLDGTTPVFDFQIGAYATENDRISYDSTNVNGTLEHLGLTDIDLSTKEGAKESIAKLDDAQNMVNGMRANIGAIQNRLVATVDILAVSEENLAAANSRIRDTDVAESSSELARSSVLQQAGVASLAQANQSTQLALKLIG
jgi:flagellin